MSKSVVKESTKISKRDLDDFSDDSIPGISDESDTELSEAAVATVVFITHGWEDFKTCKIRNCWKCDEYLERFGAKKIVYPQSMMKTEDRLTEKTSY